MYNAQVMALGGDGVEHFIFVSLYIFISPTCNILLKVLISKCKLHLCCPTQVFLIFYSSFTVI